MLLLAFTVTDPEGEVRDEVVNLCSNFPIYKNLNK